MKPSARAIVVVLDGLGVGATADAGLYGDAGADTLGNLSRALGGLELPNLCRMGIGNLVDAAGMPGEHPLGAALRMSPKSPGKDSITGHWEMCGVVLDEAFRTYPNGFPPEIMKAFESRIGIKCLGNVAASGTSIIQDLGREHMTTGSPIVYTSADSVFQIACHEEVTPLPTLYLWGQIARELLTGEHMVGRVIVRPFTGRPGEFVRTANRRDFALPPPRPTLLDYAREAGVLVTGIGKIGDIFAGRGLDSCVRTKSNEEGVQAILRSIGGALHPTWFGKELVIANLVDFDTLYGHRNDIFGYAEALRRFDSALPSIWQNLRQNDLLVLTADHGCDPTTPGTDHSREYVPALLCGGGLAGGVVLPPRDTFADLGATVAEFLELDYKGDGDGFLSFIQRTRV